MTIIECALGDESGTATIDMPLKDGQSLSIAVERLDDVCEARDIQHVGFIKCDTEGGEFAAFSGGMNCLARDLPTVVGEVAESYLARQGVEASAVFGILSLLGYRCYLILPNGALTPVKGYAEQGDYLFAHPGTMSLERLGPFLSQSGGSPIGT